LDAYFDLHIKERWSRGGKKGAHYPLWLKRNTVPVYMQERYPEVPASIRYPRERILQEFNVADNRRYFPNQVAWMTALALAEGYTTIGMFGISYASRGEYAIQRGGAEFWIGFAAGRGVRIVLPEACSLLREPAALYGYESHDERGVLIEEYQEKRFKPHETIRVLKPGETFTKAKPPAHIAMEIEEEERVHPRPDWARVFQHKEIEDVRRQRRAGWRSSQPRIRVLEGDGEVGDVSKPAHGCAWSGSSIPVP